MHRRQCLAALALTPLTACGGRNGDAGSTTRAQQRTQRFPNVLLHSHDDRSLYFYDDLIRDRQVMINFMYAACADICPGMTANLMRVQELLSERLGRDLFMYSITLDPEHDTPTVLRAYRELFSAGPGWLFLTGARADTELLRRRLGFVDPDPVIDADRSRHTGMVVIGNDAIDRWMACPAMSRPERIAQSVGWLDSPSQPKA